MKGTRIPEGYYTRGKEGQIAEGLEGLDLEIRSWLRH